MKKMKFLIVLVVLLFGANVFQYSMSNRDHYLSIKTVEEFEPLLNDEDYIFIDLRDNIDYVRGHLKPFINFPFKGENKRLINFLNTLGKDRKILLMCYGGNSSAKMFSQLVINDFHNVTDFALGYNEYKLAKGELLEESTGDCGCSD